MSHDIKEIPPFECDGEIAIRDAAFSKECKEAISSILEDSKEMEVLQVFITLNEVFGIIGRADFKTPYDTDDCVNRIMFWKNDEGELIRFCGMNLPTLPLVSSEDSK